MIAGGFSFRRFAPLSDEQIQVRVERQSDADPAKGHVPAYHCGVYLRADGERVGNVMCRIGDTEFLEMYAGHLAYEIDEPHRGHHFAERASRLVSPVFRHHGVDPVWVTCNPDNMASRRTLERLGAEFVETVDLPAGCDMYERGERRKCRYRWTLPA